MLNEKYWNHNTMRFSAPPTRRPKMHYIICYKKYAVSNKNVLRIRLKVAVHLVFLSSCGSLFHARDRDSERPFAKLQPRPRDDIITAG